MALYHKIKELSKNPGLFFVFFVNKLVDYLSDETFVKLVYFFSLGKKLNLNNPETYNEKLNWLKLNYYNPLYTELVDKASVKKYITQLIGPEYVIPTLGVWDSFEEIEFEKLPNSFVLKTTHGGGNLGVVICRNKSSFDIEHAKSVLTKSLNSDSYRLTKEWPYKNVRRRIIAEPLITDGTDNYDLKDYKFFCFGGIVEGLFVASERQHRDEPYFDFFDRDFNHLNVIQGHPNSPSLLEKPKNFDKMKEIASILSKGFPHVRVDLYNMNGTIYFGELTFFHFGGIVPFKPNTLDLKWGKMIQLPPKVMNK